MKITRAGGIEIATLEEWEAWFKSVRDPVQWKEGRSAFSLGDFIINRSGAHHLESVYSQVLGTSGRLETATPEFAARFDAYRNPAQLDLAIWGTTGEGSSLFVGVEAKVDEPFGQDTVETRYQAALRQQERNRGSRAPERVRGLVSSYSPGDVDSGLERFGIVRYQLLTGTAGALGVDQDVSVFHVLVFKTVLYEETKGRENRRDYQMFIERANGRRRDASCPGVVAHEVMADGKTLTCIYQEMERF